MNYGKLTESIYERSVVKVVKTNSDRNRKFYDGTGLGADCAIFPYDDNGDKVSLITGQALSHGKDMDIALRAFIAAVNSAIINGADKNLYANITFMLPERLREIKVRQMLERAVIKADELEIPILSANVQVIPSVNESMVCCTVNGAASTDIKKQCKAQPNEDIVMTKWLGLEGTAIIADNYFDKLCERYHKDIAEEARAFRRYLSIIPEAATAQKSGVSAMQMLREGGVFGGLWELAANNGVGLVVDLKSIPVRQETIEVCELFDLNPYELLAGGSMLITASNGAELVRVLNEQGIEAAVIGRTTSGNDKIIRHNDEQRFLEPAKGDEIYKIMV